jgi:hypothetical protein
MMHGGTAFVACYRQGKNEIAGLEKISHTLERCSRDFDSNPPCHCCITPAAVACSLTA